MDRFRSHNILWPSLAAVLLAGTAGPASAQDTGGGPAATGTGGQGGVNEVIVTARRREERLLEVPVAVTAFSADDIRRRNIESLVDVAKYTAGFSFENYAGGSNPAPIIRGLSQTTLTDRNQNVGTFVDGVHVQQQGNVDLTLMDLERIEVLKGPQNSQFGRSAFAGAINFVPRKANLSEMELDVQLTAGTDERFDGRAGFSIPLWEDKLAVRVFGVTTEFDGTWDNNFSGGDNAVATTDGGFGKSFDGTDGKLGGWDSNAIQAQVRFEPMETLRVDLGYFKSNVNNEQAAVEFIRPGGISVWGLEHETNCNPNAAGTNRFYCGELKVNSDSVRVDPRSVGLQAETQLLSALVTWEFLDNVAVTYQLGRNDLLQNGFAHSSNPPNPEREGCGLTAGGIPPCAPGPQGVLFQTGPGDQKATSHELRFDGQLFDDALTWRLGYYHSEVEDAVNLNSIETRRSLIEDPTGQVIVVSLPAPATRFDDTTDAVFGSVGYTFAEIYTLDVEARYAAEERTQPSGPLPAKTYYDFTPRVSLKAQVTPDWMVYGSVAEGSKAGGFNTSRADPGFETFDQETNTTYELGAKQVLLDGQLQLNYNVFYIDWQDLQLPTADLIPTNPPAADPNFTTNASGADSMGVELEGLLALGDNWTVNLAASYAKPEFDGDALDFGLGAQCAASTAPVCSTVVVDRPAPIPDAIAAPIGGNQLQRTPTTQVGFGVEYRNEFRAWEYRLRGDLAYQDKMYAEVLNLATLPSRTLLDINLSVTSPSRNLTLTLWGKNVTDEEYVSNSLVIGFANNYAASLAPGAAWGVTARFAFAGND
jgi:iron complex outermembrane receptor protein